jgi:hypothetical protein
MFEFPAEADAYTAQARVIANEGPKHNVIGNKNCTHPMQRLSGRH